MKLACLLLIIIFINGHVQGQTSEFELDNQTWSIIITDSLGNKDSLTFGTNKAALPNSLNPAIGEKLETIPDRHPLFFVIQKAPGLLTKNSYGLYNNTKMAWLFYRFSILF